MGNGGGITALVSASQALPEAVVRRGITEAQWRTLANNLFPGANPASVLMVWDYCVARKLDPLKKPCHIVPMEVKDAKSGEYHWRDVVMPGIYEHRTTAQRTGLYLGHAKAEYGEPIEAFGVSAPEWCDFTVYRWNPEAEQKAEFPVRVLFREVVALTKDKQTKEWKANSRWTKAPFQMLTKCAEAAALREAFPDELGGEQTFEEMDGQRAVDLPTLDAQVKPPKPDGYDDWLTDMELAAEEGEARLTDALEKSLEVLRVYLTTQDGGAWENLKRKATGAAAS